MRTPMFKIFCEVSGGETDARSGYVKRNNIDISFDERADAEHEAEKLRRAVSPHSTAKFQYSVRKVREPWWFVFAMWCVFLVARCAG